MVADYTRSDKGATAKVEAKKNLRIRAGWCKRWVRNRTKNSHQSIPLGSQLYQPL